MDDIITSDHPVLKDYIGKPITARDNQSIREWYVANVENIYNLIDKEKPLESQALQAYILRNRFKREARTAMTDTKTAKILDSERPVPTFEELVNRKMEIKGLSREEAVRDILETAIKTNSDVNGRFGL